MDNREEFERKQFEEYKQKPFVNLDDSHNRSVIGDLGALTRGGWLTRIVTTLVIIGGLLALIYFK
ncbi:hypothetical protein [Paenibacillus tepidiphilus]|uniref:hypothetical protein n=1 Tax=Paenibacillus tepidiphilus TaxID=2608683 RepID=UPI00123BB1C7|nr:hypothetical protein [Paenibacillus tepidiphilus]